MSSVYTPTAVKLVNVTLTSDLDARNAASINTPMQAIADGVAYLNTETTPLADLATLTATAAPADGLVRHVIGFGLYVFQTAVTSGLSPFWLAADDLTPGGWVSSTAHETSIVRRVPVGLGLRGITNGGSGGTPATVNPNTTLLGFTIPIGADGQLDAGSFFPIRVYTGATNQYGYLIDIHSEMIDGATLTSATLNLFPVSGHAGLPTRQPRFAICRAALPSTTTNLLSTGNGYVQLAAANTAAYQVANALVFTPDQNNTIDKSTYRYFAIILDEAGTNALAGCGYHTIELAMSALPDARRG
jgi:hypothetical protein